MEPNHAVLSAHRVVKRYGSTLALAGVDFGVRAGEVVGLVGANGAGKSTLIGILSGVTAPTEGRISVDGVEVSFGDPEGAARAGIATVHQDVDHALVPTLTVADNLVLDRLADGSLGHLPSRRRIRDAARAVVTDAAGRDTLGLDLEAPVSRLRTSQKQQLLIARALHRGARVLILDEPTAALSVIEQRALHARVRDLAARGTAVVYITHHLGELAAVCDRVVAIREGLVAGEFARPFAVAEVVSAILGPLAERVPVAPSARRQSGRVVLRLEGVQALPDSAPLDVVVHDGEVLGITGLLGAGKTELLRQIVGADPLRAGAMTFDDAAHRPRHPRDAIAAGIGIVPEDRRGSAEFPDWDIAANVTVPDLRRYRRAGLLSVRRERAAAGAVIDLLRVVASGPRASLRSLSGGNRQKVVVARWIAAGSRLLVLDEPFRGVDLGARADIAALLRSDTVRAAVVASSDPEEILEVADRILVLAGGSLVAELRPSETDPESLAVLMMARTTDTDVDAA